MLLRSLLILWTACSLAAASDLPQFTLGSPTLHDGRQKALLNAIKPGASQESLIARALEAKPKQQSVEQGNEVCSIPLLKAPAPKGAKFPMRIYPASPMDLQMVTPTGSVCK